jgi:flavin reductase (DIM6/NTAB) family NADH-FMN oxidoreductase RutF
MPISNDDFRAALANFASGVTVVTTLDAAGKMHGITVSAFCSVSLEPPLVLVCIEKSTASHDAFEESGIFVVNILGDDQERISERFATPHPDKFAGIDYEIGEFGSPVLTGAIVVLECRLIHAYDGGDHTVYVGEVKHGRSEPDSPLIYYRGRYRKLDG